MCDKPDRFQWWESFVYTDRFQWQQSFVYKKRGVDVVYSKLARPSRPPIVSLYPKSGEITCIENWLGNRLWGAGE